VGYVRTLSWTGAPEALVNRPVEEAELLASLARGDRQAAEALVDATYRQVFALLCRLSGGDRDLAADLTQETYRRAWAALACFDGRSRLATWLYRIATNVFLNHVRRPHLVVPLEEEHVRTRPDGEPPQDEALADAEAQERLRRAVLALPDPLRTVVVAHFWAESPVSEIARAEGLSAMGVRKRIKRALRLLGRALQEGS